MRLPTSQADLLKHYTLSDEDLGHIRQRRRAHNRFGFALQLCVLRHPGRVLAPGELIPAEVIDFIGARSSASLPTILLTMPPVRKRGTSIFPNCGRSMDSAPSPGVVRAS